MALVGAAQADVKVYGALDMSFGSFETAHAQNNSNRVTAVSSGSMMTSFLGFGGSEDLGGGLKAEFALETFIAGDTGATLGNNAGQFWGRASNVALSGGFGKVAIGQYDNPLFTTGYTYNPFGSSMTFSPTMRHFGYIGQTAGIPNSGVGFDTGWVNSLTYESPNLGGFTGIAQFTPKETTSAVAEAKNSYALAGAYNAGPFSAMLTYVRGGKNTTGLGYVADEKVTNLGISYDFGVVKAFGQYTYIKEAATAAIVVSPSLTVPLGTDNKSKIYQLGVSVPVGASGAILASYGELKNETAITAKDRVFSLGYDHNLSKRTDVYAVFMNNQQSANTGNVESGQSFAVGIKHNF
jgi:predicted porin